MVNFIKSSPAQTSTLNQLLPVESAAPFKRIKELFMFTGSSAEIARLANRVSGSIASGEFKDLMTSVKIGMQQRITPSKNVGVILNPSVLEGSDQDIARAVKRDLKARGSQVSDRQVSDREVAKTVKAILSGSTSVKLIAPLSEGRQEALFKAIDREYKIGFISEHACELKSAATIVLLAITILGVVGLGISWSIEAFLNWIFKDFVPYRK